MKPKQVGQTWIILWVTFLVLFQMYGGFTIKDGIIFFIVAGTLAFGFGIVETGRRIK